MSSTLRWCYPTGLHVSGGLGSRLVLENWMELAALVGGMGPLRKVGYARYFQDEDSE